MLMILILVKIERIRDRNIRYANIDIDICHLVQTRIVPLSYRIWLGGGVCGPNQIFDHLNILIDRFGPFRLISGRSKS